jgi:hypothetical protein
MVQMATAVKRMQLHHSIWQYAEQEKESHFESKSQAKIGSTFSKQFLRDRWFALALPIG